MHPKRLEPLGPVVVLVGAEPEPAEDPAQNPALRGVRRLRLVALRQEPRRGHVVTRVVASPCRLPRGDARVLAHILRAAPFTHETLPSLSQ